eukprot:TRINITY_DN748_c0_g1_i5.p1 TRINITY_DN748_c0_g1~~TRINITY_DN748_c0_g1_i5.p1  ORF type:complete len:271 (+),score=60.00 TRINITY_DN748_c0_g1_i5:243-1055(+)
MIHLDKALNDIVKQTEDEKTVRGRGALKAGNDERSSGSGGFRRKTFIRGSTAYDQGHQVRKMEEKWQHDLFVEDQDDGMDGGEPESYGGKVKVTNLASTVTEADLKGIFGEAGTITKVTINYGYAVIFYSKMKEAVEASRTFNGISLENRDIVVTLVAKGGSSSSGGSGRRATGSSSGGSGGLRMIVGKEGRTAKLTRPASHGSVHRVSGLEGGHRDTRRVAPKQQRTAFRGKSSIDQRNAGPRKVKKTPKTTKESLDADLDMMMSSRDN